MFSLPTPLLSTPLPEPSLNVAVIFALLLYQPLLPLGVFPTNEQVGLTASKYTFAVFAGQLAFAPEFSVIDQELNDIVL